jgi:hypothetical protein
VVAAIDWTTVASLATAAGTLVLAIATFAAVRSANAAARTSERSLMAGLRPVLFESRPEDPVEHITWVDHHVTDVAGGQATIEIEGDVVYLTISVRNEGSGIGVLHGWHLWPDWQNGVGAPADPDEFRRQSRDLYIPPGGTGFWQGALRDADDRDRAPLLDAVKNGERVIIDLLYGDVEGGNRTISRFSLSPEGDVWRAIVVRHFQLDGPDPR